MTTRLPERLELRQRMFQMSRTQRWVLVASVLLILAVMAASPFLLFRNTPHGDRIAAAMLDGLRNKLVAHPLDALLHSLPLEMELWYSEGLQAETVRELKALLAEADR